MNNPKGSNFILFKGISEKEHKKETGTKKPLMSVEINDKYSRTESLRLLDNLFSESPIRRSDIPKKLNIHININNNNSASSINKKREENVQENRVFPYQSIHDITKEEEESLIINNNDSLEQSPSLSKKSNSSLIIIRTFEPFNISSVILENV